MTLLIKNGNVLSDGAFLPADIAADRSGLQLDPSGIGDGWLSLDATGCLVLPGIVDIHGDAFERQIMPRPGIGFPIEMALVETERQLLANGITTAFLAVTWSWEPGLRGPENARSLLAGLEAYSRRSAADLRYHLRHETFNLDAEAEILDWIAAGRIALLAFNDHMADIVEAAYQRKAKIGRMVERAGVSEAEFLALVERVWARREEVPASVARLARAAEAAGVTMLSHDDASPEDRAHFRRMGCAIAEFPKTVPTAEDAVAHREAVVFGAPNVIRGGSHVGCPAASEMAARGLCTILASDYFYPALAQAPNRLADDGTLPFAKAWELVSTNPARAAGLTDRGEIAEGKRADLVVARKGARGFEILATIAGGRLAHLGDPALLQPA